MKKFLHVLRLVLISISGLVLLNFLFAGDIPVFAALFWAVLGGVSLYFEWRAKKKQPELKKPKGAKTSQKSEEAVKKNRKTVWAVIIAVIATVTVLGGLAFIALLVFLSTVSSGQFAQTPQPQPITVDALYLAVNDVRRENGLPQFSQNYELNKSSKLKCDDMVASNYYGHTNPATNKAGNTYIQDVGQRGNWVNENLNRGVFSDSRNVIDNWLQSPPHKAAILDPKFDEVGFAVCIVPQWPGETTIVMHQLDI